jgi:hypothetical protein
MISLTLTQTSGGSAVVTVSCAVVFGTNWFDKRWNHYAVRSADAGTTVYDVGPNEIEGVILMKGLSSTDGGNLITWIRDSVIFDTYLFTISAIANLNLGKGTNTACTSCRYNGAPSLEGIYDFVAPGIYDFNFPYRLLR